MKRKWTNIWKNLKLLQKKIKSKISLKPLSEKAKNRLLKFFRVFDFVTFGIAFVVYVISDRTKIFAPLTLLASWGIGRAFYYVLTGTLQGTYMDGVKKGAEMESHLSKSTMSLVKVLEIQIKILEERLKNKTQQTEVGETSSRSIILRRFMKRESD